MPHPNQHRGHSDRNETEMLELTGVINQVEPIDI